MFIFTRCVDTRDVARPSESDAYGIQAEMQPAGAVYSIAPRSQWQGDRKSRTALQRRSQRTARQCHCHDNRGRHPARSPVSPLPSRPAAQPAPQSPAPPNPARPSSAHLPGAPRPGHLLSPGLRAAHPGFGLSGCCRVLKTGRDLFSDSQALARGVHPRPEPAVPAQPETYHRLLSEHGAQPRPGSAPSPRLRAPLLDRRPAPSLTGSAPRRPHLP